MNEAVLRLVEVFSQEFFGMKLPQFPDRIDLYAMTALNQQEFVRELIPLFRAAPHVSALSKNTD